MLHMLLAYPAVNFIGFVRSDNLLQNTPLERLLGHGSTAGLAQTLSTSKHSLTSRVSKPEEVQPNTIFSGPSKPVKSMPSQDTVQAGDKSSDDEILDVPIDKVMLHLPHQCTTTLKLSRSFNQHRLGFAHTLASISSNSTFASTSLNRHRFQATSSTIAIQIPNRSRRRPPPPPSPPSSPPRYWSCGHRGECLMSSIFDSSCFNPSRGRRQDG